MPQDPRVIQKLHRRVFLDKLTRDEATIYLSFYVEAANRDAFMAGEPQPPPPQPVQQGSPAPFIPKPSFTLPHSAEPSRFA